MQKSRIRMMVDLINNKKFKNLNINFQNIVKTLFPNVKNEDLIECECFGGKKIDIVFKCNSEYKYVSIKGKNEFCVFKGDSKILLRFLFSLGISYQAIMIFINKGNTKYLYNNKNILQEEISADFSVLNEEFKRNNNIFKLLYFLLVKEKNDTYVDYFYFGNERNGVIISRDFLIKNIIKDFNQNDNPFKFGPFSLTYLHQNNNLISVDERKYCSLKINLYKYKKK